MRGISESSRFWSRYTPDNPIHALETRAEFEDRCGRARVAVVGVPDPKWGETPIACVVSRNTTLTVDDLGAATSDKLTVCKRPRRLVLPDGLPRNSTGKALRRDLRESVQNPEE